MTLAKTWRQVVKRVSRRVLPESRKTVIHTHINGYDLLVLANEEVGRAIHFGRNFESSETEFLKKAIRPNSTCIDIGANIGYFTLLMAQTARLGKTYAFEPISLNAALLRASSELNGFKNITIMESAVGASDGEVSMNQSTDSAFSSIQDTERKAVERVIRVPITKLDTFVDQHSIQSVDVLKIDVEGAEGLVLAGSKALLSDEVRRPRIILIELYDENLSSYNTRASVIIDTLRSFDYRPFFISSGAELQEFSSAELASSYNVLFLDARSKGHG